MSIPLNNDLYFDEVLTPGKIANHDPATLLKGLIAQEAIPFGYAVTDGNDNNQQTKIISGASAKFRGVAAYNPYAAGIDEIIPSYGALDGVDVLDRGYITVVTTEAVDKSDVVRVFHTGANKGKFTGTASAGNTSVISGAEWNGSFASGVAVVKLNGGFATTADT
jgi:hypothetical protein